MATWRLVTLDKYNFIQMAITMIMHAFEFSSDIWILVDITKRRLNACLNTIIVIYLRWQEQVVCLPENHHSWNLIQYLSESDLIDPSKTIFSFCLIVSVFNPLCNAGAQLSSSFSRGENTTLDSLLLAGDQWCSIGLKAE